MLFGGEYFYQLDDKNRMRLPMKLRLTIGNGKFYILGIYPNCLYVVTDERMAAFEERVKATLWSDEEGQEELRDILSLMNSPEEDGQGRFVLPENLREYASIDKNVAIIGVGDHIEIWNEEAYRARRAARASVKTSPLEALRKYGL